MVDVVGTNWAAVEQGKPDGFENEFGLGISIDTPTPDLDTEHIKPEGLRRGPWAVS